MGTPKTQRQEHVIGGGCRCMMSTLHITAGQVSFKSVAVWCVAAVIKKADNIWHCVDISWPIGCW